MVNTKYVNIIVHPDDDPNTMGEIYNDPFIVTLTN